MKINIENIDYNEALRYLGYKGKEISDALVRQIKSCGEKALDVISPKGIYQKHGRDVIMAVTLGSEMDRLISKTQLTNMSDAVIIDAIASTLAEQTADELEKEIRADFEVDGKVLGGRFSPGYGDFPLTAQKGIIELLEADKRIGLTLNKNGMLSPVKSITAIIKIYDEGEKIEKVRGCGSCNIKETCGFRKGSR